MHTSAGIRRPPSAVRLLAAALCLCAAGAHAKEHGSPAFPRGAIDAGPACGLPARLASAAIALRPSCRGSSEDPAGRDARMRAASWQASALGAVVLAQLDGSLEQVFTRALLEALLRQALDDAAADVSSGALTVERLALRLSQLKVSSSVQGSRVILTLSGIESLQVRVEYRPEGWMGKLACGSFGGGELSIDDLAMSVPVDRSDWTVQDWSPEYDFSMQVDSCATVRALDWGLRFFTFGALSLSERVDDLLARKIKEQLNRRLERVLGPLRTFRFRF